VPLGGGNTGITEGYKSADTVDPQRITAPTPSTAQQAIIDSIVNGTAGGNDVAFIPHLKDLSTVPGNVSTDKTQAIAFGQIEPFDNIANCPGNFHSSGAQAADQSGFCSNNPAASCTKGNEVTACGGANLCLFDDSFEAGHGYSETITATGGTFYFVCN